MNVLIVEDEKSLRTILKMLCETSGYQVVEAENGAQAQKLLESETGRAIDAVISDLRMPVMSGIELMNWVKDTSQIPFILMTGYAETEEERARLQGRADGIVSKPFRKKDFLDILDQCFSTYKPEQKAA